MRRSCPGDVMPVRGPSLVLRAVKTTAVAEGTLVAAVFSPLLCRHPYLLRSSVGVGLRLVNVEDLRWEQQGCAAEGVGQHGSFPKYCRPCGLGKWLPKVYWLKVRNSFLWCTCAAIRCDWAKPSVKGRIMPE